MDTSKEYVLMCEKAEELQNLWKPAAWDYCYCYANDFEGTPGVIVLSGYETDMGIYGHSLNFKKYECKAKHIWLPKQDQLQEMMVKDVEFNVYEIYSEIDDWLSEITGDSYAYIHYDKIPYSSKEQILLAFVMNETFNKQWNDAEWITITH